MAFNPTRLLVGVLVFGASLGFSIPASFSEEEEKVLDVQVYLTKKQAFEIAFPGAD